MFPISYCCHHLLTTYEDVIPLLRLWPTVEGVREEKNTHARGILKNYRLEGQARRASQFHVTPPLSSSLPERFSPGTLAHGSQREGTSGAPPL